MGIINLKLKKTLLFNLNQKLAILSITFIFIIFFNSCKKENSLATNQSINIITLSEIKEWSIWYNKSIDGAPKMLIEYAESGFLDNHFFVRVPLENSKGMIYFTKTSTLQACFIRANLKNSSTLDKMDGNIEFIDLNKPNNPLYRVVTISQGKPNYVYTGVFGNSEKVIGSSGAIIFGNFWFDLGCLLQFGIPMWNDLGQRVCMGGIINWSKALFDIITDSGGSDANTATSDPVTIIYIPIFVYNPAYTGYPQYGMQDEAVGGYNYTYVPNSIWTPFWQSDSNIDPFLNKPIAPDNFVSYHYWEDQSYDVNLITFPPCDPLSGCVYDQDGFRKNGPEYIYSNGTVQNYTNDGTSSTIRQYAIFTKANGEKVYFPGATITNFNVPNGKGVTTSNGGIHADLKFTLAGLQHEYGHYLQAKKYGSALYNAKIVPSSLWSMATNSQSEHDHFWTEMEANQLSIAFFGPDSDIAKNPINYPR